MTGACAGRVGVLGVGYATHKYCHFHIRPIPDIIALMDDLVEVKVRPDEAATLGDTRCGACGHLEGLHNYHCCSFCTVEGCRCEWGKITKPDPDWQPTKGDEVILTRSPPQESV